jgi:hypothetical protein
MVVGVGFVALLTGAIAQRFLATETEDVSDSVAGVETTETELLEELAAISRRLQALEQRIRRQSGTSPGGVGQ